MNNTEINTEVNANTKNLEALSLKILAGLLLGALVLLGWGLKVEQAENASLREAIKDTAEMAEKSAALFKEAERSLASTREARERELTDLHEAYRLMEMEAEMASKRLILAKEAKEASEQKTREKETSLAAYKAANEALAASIPKEGWKAKAFQWLQ